MKQILRTNLALKAFMLVALFVGAVSSTWADEVDVLNRDFTGVPATGYANWEDKEGTSGTVYAGQSAGGNGSIQLRSKENNSGIVVTSSVGSFKSISITWNSSTTSSRTLQVYGSNAPYTSATDLYSTSTQGTLIGELCVDDAANGVSTLTSTDDYAYIGFRSKNGALYLSEVSITWETSGDTPVLQPAGLSFGDVTSFSITEGDAFTAPELVNPNQLPVTYSSDNEDVATVNSQTGAVTIEGIGTAVITATFEGDDTFRAGHASYTITVKEPASIVGDIASLARQEAGDYILTLTNAVVTYVDPTGKYAFLEDASGAITIYNKEGALKNEVTVPLLGTYSLEPGLTLNGTAQVTLSIFNSLPEIDFTIDDALAAVQARTATVTKGTAPQPLSGSLEQLAGDNYSSFIARYMRLEGVTATSVNNKNVTVKAGDTEFAVYLQNGGNMEVNHIYNLVGVPGIFRENRQFVVYDTDLIEDITPEDSRVQTVLTFEESSVSLSVGEVLEGIEATHNLADFPNAFVSYAVEPEGIINYENGIITALATGKATITASVTETSDFTAATATLVVNVTEPVEEADETIVFAELGYENAEELTTVKGNDVTLTFDKGNNKQNNPKYYDKGTAARIYTGNTLTINGNSREIARIEFTLGQGSLILVEDKDDAGQYANGVWTGAAADVTFTTTTTTYIEKIAITYGDGVVDPRLDLSFADASGLPITSLDMKALEDNQVYVIAQLNGQKLGRVPFQYESSDPDVVEVEEGDDMSLILSANGVGQATITVTIEDGETEDAVSFRGATATLNVNVKTNKIETELTFDPAMLDLEVGQTADANLSTNLSSLADVKITNSNPEVATYENGIVTALAVGTTTITATFAETDSYTAARATLRITVEEAIDPNADVIVLKGYAEEDTMMDEVAISTDRAIVTFSTGEGKTKPQYYVNGDAVRFYLGNVLNIKATAFKMEKIEFRFASASYNTLSLADENNGQFQTSESAGNIATWTGNAAEVNFTNLESGKQSRIERIIIYYGDEVGIAQTRDAQASDNIIYDLAGRRVKATKAGLYIVGGKKVLVK